MNITIFLPTGKTYSFKDVADLYTNETLVTFKYQSQSAPLGRMAVFYVAQIAGIGRDGEEPK